MRRTTSSLYLPAMATLATRHALDHGLTPPDTWGPVPDYLGMEWAKAGWLWVFRFKPNPYASRPPRIAAIDPTLATDCEPAPPREALPTSLPRSCPPVGWRYVSIMLAVKEVSAMAWLGHPTYLWHARATRNGPSSRPGRRRAYTIPVSAPRQPGGLIRVTYTPSLGQAVPMRGVAYPMKGTLPTDWAPGTWQDTLLQHLRALSTW